MDIRKPLAAMALTLSMFNGASQAQTTDGNADAFAKMFLTTCMQYLNNLEGFRTTLKNNNLPKFPPEQAALFLQNQPGDAWPIPHQGQMGNFVLSLPTGKNVCFIHVRRANQNDAERLFKNLVANAPSPLVSEPKKEEQVETAANGKARTIAYTWSLPQANRKMLFMLTTTAFENAQIQVLASASMVSE
jgi:hypothetical protein